MNLSSCDVKKHSRTNKWLFVILSLFITIFGREVRADIGLDWLAESYSTDGSYSSLKDSGTGFQSTSEVLRTLNALNLLDIADKSTTLMYLDTESYLSSENLARKIITKTDEGLDNSSLVNQLFTYANSRGGFGESEGHHVTVLDTAKLFSMH